MLDDRNPEDIEPTDADIAAAQAAEEAARREATKVAAKATTPPKRGPGRPPGSPNKKPSERAAREASKTPTKVVAPSTPPIDDTAATRAAREAKKKERKKRVAEVTKQLDEMRPDIAAAIGMATGIPASYLIVEKRTPQGKAVVDQDGDPVRELTHYGEVLAPKPGQLKMVAKAWVAGEETESGAKIAESLDRYMPYAMMAGGVIALGMWAVSATTAASAVKQMIAEEIAQTGGAPRNPEGATAPTD